jgi:hypothetical protein
VANREERKALNKHWLRKLLRGEPHFIIGEGDRPYLRRWFLIPRNPFLNVYLHHFLRSDDDRALHDHPWHFLSMVLKGRYIEHREGRPETVRIERTAGSIAFRKAGTLHRVELDTEVLVGSCWTMYRYEAPCWTLVITGPKLRDWGFKCPRGWVPWQYFDHNNGCGEYA